MAFPTPDKSYYPPHLVVRPTEAFVSICPNVSSVGVLGASPTGGIEIAAGLDGRDMFGVFHRGDRQTGTVSSDFTVNTVMTA